MDSRATLVFGGLSAVAASVAVVCAVAVANSAALADAPGTALSSARVLVPAATSPVAPQSTAGPADVPSQAEVVAAPEPVIVDHGSTPDVLPSAPETPTTQRDAAIAASRAAGDWEPARSWARANGWSQQRVESWIAELQSPESADEGWNSGNREHDGGNAGDDERSGESELSWQPEPQERPLVVDESRQRPAQAGSNAEHREDSSGFGSKKDRSRDSPDRRDR